MKQIKDSNFNKQFNDETFPLVQDLLKPYKEPLEKKHNPTRKQPNESKNFEKFDSMNRDTTIEQIKQTIKKMKNKKALGNGSITNEMIECYSTKFVKTGYHSKGVNLSNSKIKWKIKSN